MANLKYYDIILKPIITEKALVAQADKLYTFYVHPKATKIQIREAFEKLFAGTKVLKVNTLNLEGKIRRRGKTSGKTAKRKKAFIKLTSESKEISLFN